MTAKTLAPIRAELTAIRKGRSERIRQRRRVRQELERLDAVIALDDRAISRLKQATYRRPSTQS